MHALLLTLALAAGSDLEKAHQARDKTHVLVVMRVDSSIEEMNKGVVQVFGTRREYQCPTMELRSETACTPCELKVADWVERPTEMWLYEVTYADPESQKRATEALDHFGRYFDLAFRSGTEKGGARHNFYELNGKKVVKEDAEVARVRFVDANGADTSAAVVPGRSRDVTIQAKAQRRGDSGSLEEFPEAKLAFKADCATVTDEGGGKARVELKPGVSRCELKALGSPGTASAALVVRRELTLDVTYEGQAVEDMVVEGADFLVLGFEARAGAQPVELEPKWSCEGCKLEPVEGRKVKFRLEKGAKSARVVVEDAQSGAVGELKVRRKAD